MTFTDCYGLPVTTGSRGALDWYNRGIRGLLGFHKDTAECFEKALALDPHFNMARSHLGMAYFLDETAEQVARAKECFTRSCTAMEHLTDRERDVLETVLMWAQGNAREALERMRTALAARPGEVTLPLGSYLQLVNQAEAVAQAREARTKSALPPRAEVVSQRRTSLRTCAIIVFESAPPRRRPSPG